MKFGSSKLLISAAVAVAFPSLSVAAPFFHSNDASVDGSPQACQDFRITYPATQGLSWTDGSLHTLAWQATSTYDSVAIALVDAQNQTVSDFGSYDVSQGVTGEKAVSIQGHPNGLYHFEFTVKSSSDAECKLSSNSIQISSESSSTGGDSATGDASTGNTSTGDAPSSGDLDNIFDDLVYHGNDGWSSTDHADDTTVTPPSEDELNEIFAGLSGHSNDGWTSTEHGDDGPSDSDFSDLAADPANHGNDESWTSHEDDVNETPGFWHSDDVTDFVTAAHANDVDSNWTSHEDDVENDNNDANEPKNFHDFIESLDQPYEDYLKNNDATEGQTLTSHKNDVDTGDDDWSVDEGDSSDKDLSDTLDDIFSKLTGNHGAAGNGTNAGDASTTTTSSGDHSNDRPHWNSEDDSYFTNEVAEVDDTKHDNAGEDSWQEDDGKPVFPSTNTNSAEPKHWNSDDNTYFTNEYSNGVNGASTAGDSNAPHNNANWEGDDHSDDAGTNWFTDVHSNDVVPPNVQGVPETHGNDATKDRWFTDVHNDDAATPGQANRVPESHGNDATKDRWFTDVHNDDAATPGQANRVPESHGNDATKDRWFTDVHNDDAATPGQANRVPESHGNDATKDRWFTDVHNDDAATPGQANRVPENHGNEDPVSRWSSD